MRFVLPFVVFFAGCVAPTSAFPLREECRLGAWLALHIATEAPPLKVPSPDKPDQGDTCEECGGTGKLGDGTVFVKCGACNGTGRKPAAAFDTPESTEAFQAAELKQEAAPKVPVKEQYAVPPKDGRTFRKVCRNGVCAWEPVPQ
jgi:hypothetical protein